MKKFMLILTATVILTGCGDRNIEPQEPEKPSEPEVPKTIFFFPAGAPYGLDMTFVVRNTSGDNLLDAATQENILNNEVKVEYRGKTYFMNVFSDDDKFMLNIEQVGISNDGVGFPALCFGPFVDEILEEGYHGETLTVDWGDGTTSDVEFDVWLSDFSTEFPLDERGIFVEIIRGDESSWAAFHANIRVDGELVDDTWLWATIVK